MELALAIGILAVVAAAVLAPLLRQGEAAGDDAESDAEGLRLADLRTRKEAKLAEIRDAELERAAGKLSMEDWRRLDRELRSEAIEVIKALDELEAR